MLWMDQLQMLIKYIFFEQLSISYIPEIWFPNKEESKVFQAVFVLCLYTTHLFIFVNISELVHRSQLTMYFYRQPFI
jgi:hypothetical protein